MKLDIQMMEDKTTQYDDDDGRVIIDMNVEGTPWHDKHSRQKTHQGVPGNQLTKSQARLYTWYSIRAGLLVGFVFSATWVLFVLFCTQIWFR